MTSGGENAQGQPAPITCAGRGEESRVTGEGPPKPSPAPVQTGQLLLGGQWCSVAQNTLCPHPTPAPACASLHPSPSSSQGPIKGTLHGPPSDMRAGTVPADNARVGLRQVSPRGQLRPPAHQAPPARHCSNRCSRCHGDCFAHAAGAQAQAGGWRGGPLGTVRATLLGAPPNPGTKDPQGPAISGGQGLCNITDPRQVLAQGRYPVAKTN